MRFTLGRIEGCIRSDDPEFNARCSRTLADCVHTAAADWAAPDVVLRIACSLTGDSVIAEISGDAFPTDLSAVRVLLPELHRVPEPRNGSTGWNLFARSGDPRPVVAVRANQLVVDRSLPWQIFVAHYFLNHLMQRQPQLCFVHGATVAAGARGVLLCGAKGAGKSTLSLALAARGHAFLGDEVATLETGTGLLLPFPRAVSIRPGPQARVVARFLRDRSPEHEELPDGTVRVRIAASALFPVSKARPAPLTHAFFLTGAASAPAATAVDFSLAHLPLLAPLHASLANVPVGQRMLHFADLFRRARCYMLSPGGTPDQTAELIENIVEERWVTA